VKPAGPSASAAPDLRLLPLDLWVPPAAGPLLDRLRLALAGEARLLGGPQAVPLRWAVTAADPERGLRLEGVVLGYGADY
jgi:hypothetical protein